MTEFQKGQRVKIEYEGTVISGAPSYVEIHPDHFPPGHNQHLALESVTVTVLDPPDWPPQVGDVWEADDMEYYVRQRAPIEGILIHSFERDDTRHFGIYWCPEDLDGFKALNPVLVRRRGQ